MALFQDFLLLCLVSFHLERALELWLHPPGRPAGSRLQGKPLVHAGKDEFPRRREDGSQEREETWKEEKSL